MQYSEFKAAVQSYLSEQLSSYGTSYGSNTIFGQIVNVLGGIVQNMLSYIEDSLTEQNIYTAQRKRSVYNLAVLSGYKPSLGTASTCDVAIMFKPNNDQMLDVVIPNHTQLDCLQNGLVYNIMLPQESIVMSLQRDNSIRHIALVEGVFENQTFISSGGQLYTINVIFNGDADLQYMEVRVNDELWEQRDSLYDMDSDGKQYNVRPSLKNGADLVFGNDEFGRALKNGDVVKVSYLIHSGEMGNINPDEECIFQFSDSLKDVGGNEVDGNALFAISLKNRSDISCGTNSESVRQVKEMVGLNSRSLVLADPKNYNMFFNKFSFVGYSRAWSDRGSLVINAIVMKNYAAFVSKGSDYFSLSENDFRLSDTQKNSIISNISNSGQQLAGAVLNIFDPELAKYAAYIYLKLKPGLDNDRTFITSKVRDVVGRFFTDISSDEFIPKSDIIHAIKNEVDEVDGVDVYFISAANEKAKMDGRYINKEYIYNPSTGTYKTVEETVYVYEGEDPQLGLDGHGNILLKNDTEFPVLMGGWQMEGQMVGGSRQIITISDPLTIIYE